MSTTQQQMNILAREGHLAYMKIEELQARIVALEAVSELLREQRQQAIDECKRLEHVCDGWKIKCNLMEATAEIWEARAKAATALIASELVDDLGDSQ